MSTGRKPAKKTPGKKSWKMFIIAGSALILAAVLFIAARGRETEGSQTGKDLATGKDLLITKSNVTEDAGFYPIKAGGKNMEILAVKGSDGAIRTAFNTCQVCNGSPYAYYKQEKDVLVCQNCGNRFSMDMVEQKRGGCNPIPIDPENKVEDENSITIPWEFIENNSGLFSKDWKTQ